MSKIEYPARLTDGFYRVRETWEDAASQVGAYRLLTNAKAAADKHPGTYVFTDDGVKIYPEEESGMEPGVEDTGADVENGTEEENPVEDSTTEETDAAEGTEDAEDGTGTIDATDSTDTSDTDEGAAIVCDCQTPILYGRLKTLLNIRSGPSLDADILTTRPKGTLVGILQVLEGWYKIAFDEEDADNPSAEAGSGIAYVSADENFVDVGTSLYTVQPRDSLWKIAEKHLGSGVRYTQIRQVNGLTSNSIRVGQVLLIPYAGEQ